MADTRAPAAPPGVVRFGRFVAFGLAGVGVAILIAWWVTRWEPLVLAGFLFLYGAVPLNLAALVAIGVAFIRRRKDLRADPRERRAYAFAALLLMLDYPLAALCVAIPLKLLLPNGAD